MKTIIRITCLLFALTLAACVRMPTEKQGVVDLRPQISFVVDRQNHNARILLNGADMGRVGDFEKDRAALRILPGTHELRVELGGQLLLEEKFYVGDGVSRSFVIR